MNTQRLSALCDDLVLAGVTCSGCNTLRGYPLNPGEILSRQCNLKRSEVLLHPLQPLGAGNRHDLLPLRKEPGQRKLCRGVAFLGCHLPDQRDDLQVPGEVLSLEPRVMAAVIILRQILEALDLSSQKSRPSGL